MTPICAHVGLATALAVELAKQAGHAPEDARPALLEGATLWAWRAAQVKAPIVLPDPNCSDKGRSELVEHYAWGGVTWSVAEPAGLRRWKFDGELLAMPPGFEEAVAQAKRIELNFIEAHGGDSLAAAKMIAVLKARGVPVIGHIEKFACSAHADLFVLGCTHRVMHPRAKLMLHPSHCVGFGTSETLIRHAASLREHDNKRALAYAARTGQPLELVTKWVCDGNEKNYWFDAKRAIAANLVDQVI